MQEYIDDKYLVANGIILTYSGEEEDVAVPSSLGGMPIHTIGMGAFHFCDAKNIIVSDGIRRIRDSAFNEARNLDNILLFPSVKEVEPKILDYCYHIKRICQILCYTEAEYNELKSICACDGGTRYMAYEIPSIGDNAYLSPAIIGFKKQYKLPRGIRRLFVFQHDSYGFPVSFDHEFRGTLHTSDIFHSVSSKTIDDEMEALPYLVKEGFPMPNPMVERENTRVAEDQRKHWNHVNAGRSMVFLFDDNNTRHIGDKYYVIGEYSIGYHFWQSLIPQIRNGKRFFLYRRCFLGAVKDYSTPDLEYIRYNICYCDEKGQNRWK